jgi:hypothetical protein
VSKDPDLCDNCDNDNDVFYVGADEPLHLYCAPCRAAYWSGDTGTLELRRMYLKGDGDVPLP